MQYFGVRMFSGEGKVWNVMEIIDCWNLLVHVRTYPGRAGFSVSCLPEDVIVVSLPTLLRRCDCVSMLCDAFACGVLVLAMRRYSCET